MYCCYFIRKCYNGLAISSIFTILARTKSTRIAKLWPSRPSTTSSPTDGASRRTRRSWTSSTSTWTRWERRERWNRSSKNTSHTLRWKKDLSTCSQCFESFTSLYFTFYKYLSCRALALWNWLCLWLLVILLIGPVFMDLEIKAWKTFIAFADNFFHHGTEPIFRLTFFPMDKKATDCRD